MLTEWLGLAPTPLNIFLTIWGSGTLFFLVASSASYAFFFIWQRARFHPDYVADRATLRMAVKWGFFNILGNAVLTAPFHLLIAYGHSQIYFRVSDHPWWTIPLSIVGLLAVTETLIYWAHRMLHVSPLYEWLHEPHHRYQRPMSWAGLAFHPVDSFLQALPHHLCVFLFPVHVGVYLTFVTFVTLWAVMIHDRVSVVRWPVINYTGHHSIHHRDFAHNYGQFFTLWDRLGGTWRDPAVYGCEGDYFAFRGRFPGPQPAVEERAAV